MAILSGLEKKTVKGKVIVIALYFFVTIGGLSMVIPFLTMIGDSLRSNADARFQGDRGILPAYLFNDEWLWRKYLITKYGSIDNINKIRNRNKTSYVYAKDINFFKPKTKKYNEELLLNDYFIFMNSYKQKHLSQFYIAFFDKPPLNLSCWLMAKKFMLFLKERYKTIENLNQAYSENNTDWTSVANMQEALELREWFPDYKNARVRDWYDFKRELPEKYLFPANLDERFSNFLERKNTFKKISGKFALGDDLNESDAKYNNLKLEFIKTRVPLRFIRIKKDAFISWLKNRYTDLSSFNIEAGERLSNWTEISLPLDFGMGSHLFDKIIKDFVAQMKYQDFTLSLPQTEFRAFLRAKYLNIENLNFKYSAFFKSFKNIKIPINALDRKEFNNRKSYLRGEFALRNFLIVIDYLLINGRAFPNTFILVIATIFFALTVNPLCAYALSRFNLKFSHQILLFCLTTMAFPPEVTMIPSFLMLKEFHLLNSFPALFLPGIANGFGIFLLKGFFDSLPDELFDAARIDGCSEILMFWKIALPLTKPVLAVIALEAFTASYGGFLWAYIVCPDSRYWTIMVQLYALTKMGVGVGIQSAGFLLATIPTFIVFLLAQKIILEGIVVPQMK